MVEMVLLFPGVEGRRCGLLGPAHSRWSLIRPLCHPGDWSLKGILFPSSFSPGSWSRKVPTPCSKQPLVSGRGGRVPQGSSLLLLPLSESIKGGPLVTWEMELGTEKMCGEGA